MKTLAVSNRSRTLRDLLKLAETTDLILESSDGVQFFLTCIEGAEVFHVGEDGDFEKEIESTRKNRRLMDFLDDRSSRAKGHRGTPISEVKEKLGL